MNPGRHPVLGVLVGRTLAVGAAALFLGPSARPGRVGLLASTECLVELGRGHAGIGLAARREALTRFLSGPAVEARVSASTQNQALAALLFLYRETLGLDFPRLDDLVRAKRSKRLPVVMTREEVRAVLEHLDGAPRLLACLLYGSGLRLLEACRLRVKDVELGRNLLVVRSGRATRTG